jgi:hypothetical protein
MPVGRIPRLQNLSTATFWEHSLRSDLKLEELAVDRYTAPLIHQQHESTLKPARFENGVSVVVPLFVKAGDVIRLDLQAMKYMDRGKTDR